MLRRRTGSPDPAAAPPPEAHRDPFGPGRPPGSAAERDALGEAGRLMAEAGLDPELEGFVELPRPALGLALHLGLAALAAELGARAPLAAMLLLAIVGLSATLELSGRRALLRRLLPYGRSYNVLARVPPRGKRRGTCVLLAAIDQRRRGHHLDRRLLAILVGLGLAAAWAASLVACGVEAAPVRWLQLGVASTFALCAIAAVVASGLGMDHDGGAVRSAVRALIAAGREFARAPAEGVELAIVAAGCTTAFGGGVRALCEQHPAWEPGRTLFVALHRLAPGRLAWVTGEGPAWPWRYPATVPGLLERLARHPRWRGLGEVQLRESTGLQPAAARGHRVGAITTLPGRAPLEGPAAVAERAGELLVALVRRWDRDLAEEAP